MFEIYFRYYNIDYITYNSIIEYLNLEGWKNYPFDEVIEYSAKIFKINVLISNFKYDYKYLYTINTNQKCICNFRLDCKDKEEAIKYLDTVFNVANDNLCNGYYDPPLFEVKDISVGSIILTISSWALLAILVSYSAKKVFHNLQSIKIEHALNVAIQKQLSDKTNPTTINDIDKVGKIAAKYNLINTDDDDAKLNKLSSELTKGEILSIILNLII